MSKKVKSEPLDKAALIAIIEKQLQSPDISPRDTALLTRKLSLLRGWERPNEVKWRSIADQQQDQAQERAEEPAELPSWCNETWCRVFVAERASGLHPALYPAMNRALDEFESSWAAQENMTVEQLREALCAEDREYDAQHSDAEQLAMCRSTLYQKYPSQYQGEEKTNG